MMIRFQDVFDAENKHAWMAKPFHGFSLDSRAVQSGQIFIALTSYTQPEKTIQFAQSALQNGALAVISETDLGIESALICPDVRHLMGQWQKKYLQAVDVVTPSRILAIT